MERFTKDIESKEQSMERNLLSNRIETIKALGMIEGESWLREQMEKDDKHPERIINALEWLGAGHKRGTFMINGDGAIRRWTVYPDGTIRCSLRSVNSVSGDIPITSEGFNDYIDRIKQLGFEFTT